LPILPFCFFLFLHSPFCHRLSFLCCPSTLLSSPADAVSALSLCLLDRTWELSHRPSRAYGSCMKNWKLLKKFCLKSTRKIHYHDCSMYSLDSSVTNFNMLQSKDFPFKDDTLSILLICSVIDACGGVFCILSM
jgi:hypothetical protein